MKFSSLMFAATLLSLSVGSAQADKAAYCQAYARDFSDARATGKSEWQHKYDIALDACLGAAKKPQPVKAVEAPKTAPDKPEAQTAAAQSPSDKPPVNAKPKAVAETAAPELVVGSAEWNDYCAKKYTSFNAKTGMYLSHTGVSRHCLVTKDFKG